MTTETFLAYFGIALAVVGLIASYYFYRKSIRKKEPVYSITSNNLVSGSVSTLENLNVSYKDFNVENLTISKIIFYNRGLETITQQDIKTRNPIRIASKNCSILDASVLQTNHPSNNFVLTIDKEGEFVNIGFDYLDKGQGIIIQVIHTGLASGNLEITGDIRGVSRLTRVEVEEMTSLLFQSFRQLGRSILVLIPMWLAMKLITRFQFYIPLDSSTLNFMLLIMLFTLGVITLIPWMITVTRILLRKNLSYELDRPEGLDKFIDVDKLIK